MLNWKEDDIQYVLGYNLFQLSFWVKIFYRWDNQAVETCLSPKNLKSAQLLPVQRHMYWASQIEWMCRGGGASPLWTNSQVSLLFDWKASFSLGDCLSLNVKIVRFLTFSKQNVIQTIFLGHPANRSLEEKKTPCKLDHFWVLQRA